MSDLPKISKAAARELLWHKGILDFCLDPLQREIKSKFYESGIKVNVWLMSRRLGKSHLLCTLALEMAIKKPRSVIKYLAPEAKQVRTIIRPIIQDLTKDCPEEIKPKFMSNEGIYRFPNGSEIHIAGSDNGGSEKLRGSKADLCIVDEAGFCSDLKYAVKTILLPTLLTTGGKLVLSSTPPREGDHDFVSFIEEATSKGSLIKKTVYECPRYSKEFIDREILSQYPSDQDSEFKREYMCELSRDDALQVIPEFTDELEKEIVLEVERPPHFDTYVSADWGVSDYTAVLFGYYDFKNARIVIEDELIMHGAKMNTAILVDAIKRKENENWQDTYTGETKPVFLRVCDNNKLLIQDMQQQHGLTFLATEKMGKEGYLNQARILLASKRVIIHPRCKNFIAHLKYATWNTNRTSFARSAVYGHFDFLDAFIYFTRNVVMGKNPYPTEVLGPGMYYNPKRSEPKMTETSFQLRKMVSKRRF